MTLGPDARAYLISLAAEKGLYVEGNVLKVLSDDGDEDFKRYLETAIERDKDARRRRLEVTKQIQAQNRELSEAQKENESLMLDLREALRQAETAKTAAEDSLSYLQKKTQFQMMRSIVKTAISLVVGTGLCTTVLYGLAVVTKSAETDIIGHAWNSMLGILLTNSFSIIGTIMGVKYANREKEGDD